MKKLLSVTIAIAELLLILTACGIPATKQVKEVGAVAEWDAGIAEILDAEFIFGTDGSNRIRVNFKFTNPESEPVYFAQAFIVKAFQNGVELDDMINEDINTEEGHDLIREIKDGASLNVFRTFKLNDDSSSVEVRVCTATAAENLLAMQTFTP